MLTKHQRWLADIVRKLSSLDQTGWLAVIDLVMGLGRGFAEVSDFHRHYNSNKADVK